LPAEAEESRFIAPTQTGRKREVIPVMGHRRRGIESPPCAGNVPPTSLRWHS